MRFFARSFTVLSLGVLLSTTGCAATSQDSAAESAANITDSGLHVPQGDERKAIIAAFKTQVTADLNGQVAAFNVTDPAGRFEAHGEWAYLEGILEGPNANVTPIDYTNSIYKDSVAYLGGIQRNGHFAAKFQGLAHRDADGTWKLADDGTQSGAKSYSVGPTYAAWQSWVSLPVPALRDVFAAFPFDDLHEPQGDERAAILKPLTDKVQADLNGQQITFDTVDLNGVFLSHDGWAYLYGIILGPNDNATPVDYSNSVFAGGRGAGFQGVLHHNNFAAKFKALLHKQADGSWQLADGSQAQGQQPVQGYSVGSLNYVGDPGSDFAWDIYGNQGNGNGNGNGRGDGRGNGNGNGE